MLTLLPTPIGNLKDISLNTIEQLKLADVFICEDTRVTKKLLNLLNQKLNLNIYYKNKQFISYHSHTKNITFIDMLKYKNCVYLTDAGMPCVSDPGNELINICIKNQISYNSLPGANAALLAYSLSGFSEKEFLFYGFLPHKKNRIVELEKLLNIDYLVILYESTYKIEQLIDEIYNLDEKRVIFLAKELTKLNQFFIKDEIKNIKKIDIDYRGEWVVIIESGKDNRRYLTDNQIINLDIPIKIKAKLLSKITGKTSKDIYQELINNENI